MRILSATSFPPAHRLRHKPQFDLLYRDGRRHSDKYFAVLTRPNNLSHARLGLSIAAKAVGNAVSRNRIKRLIRESFRLHQAQLPCIDIVVNARNLARESPNPQLTHSLEQLWAKLARHA